MFNVKVRRDCATMNVQNEMDNAKVRPSGKKKEENNQNKYRPDKKKLKLLNYIF